MADVGKGHASEITSTGHSRTTVDSRSRAARSAWRWRVVVAIAVVAALVGLASASHGGGALTPTIKVAPGGGSVGDQMSSFTLKDISGKKVSVPNGSPGAVIFSASSCTTCIPSMRALVGLKTRYGSRFGVTMVSIERGDTPKYLREWAALIGRVPFPLTIDSTQRLATAFNIQYMGVVVVYDAAGRIVDRLDDPNLGALETGVRKAGVA